MLPRILETLVCDIVNTEAHPHVWIVSGLARYEHDRISKHIGRKRYFVRGPRGIADFFLAGLRFNGEYPWRLLEETHK